MEARESMAQTETETAFRRRMAQDRVIPQAMVDDFTDDRKAELIAIGRGIAAQVKAAGVTGRERCWLRQFVEMYLEG